MLDVGQRQSGDHAAIAAIGADLVVESQPDTFGDAVESQITDARVSGQIDERERDFGARCEGLQAAIRRYPERVAAGVVHQGTNRSGEGHGATGLERRIDVPELIAHGCPDVPPEWVDGQLRVMGVGGPQPRT